MTTIVPRKIGLIGGLSYPSTVTYYERLSQLFNQRLGKAHSASIVLESLDFQPVAQDLARGNDRAVTNTLVNASRRLAAAGAEIVAMCCNTVHKFAPAVESGLSAEMVNICRCTARECARRSFGTVALLGSAFTMEESFYRDEFARAGVNVIVPERDDRRFIQRAIETELSIGEVLPETRARFLRVARELCARSADALVLACTEIPLVIHQSDVEVPVIDTVEVHCASIFERAFAPVAERERSLSCAAPI